MRKIGTVFIVGLLVIGFAFAGGLVTNSNQSADFHRLLNRNATTDIDAVYFNPAGITLLKEGLSFYLSSQTIDQNRFVNTNITGLNNDGKYEGSTFAPIFPNFYVAYKTGNLAFGAGFVPIGGGGSAEFDDGLPSFEAPLTALVGQLAPLGVTGYNLDIAFEGSSVYMGGQAVVSYKINDMFSVSAGARYFTAKNTYLGHLKDIMAETAGGDVVPGNILRGVAAIASNAAQQLQAGVDAGAIPSAALPLSAIDADGSITAGLTQLGIDPTGFTVAHAIGAYNQAAAGMTAGAAQVDAQTGDIDVDTEATGSGFAPIFGLYVSPLEGLDIGVRYEGKAALELEYATKVDGSGLFTDGRIENADMPAMLGAGVSYKVMPNLRLVADFNYYFNEDVNWDGREEFVENGTEMGIGAEFMVSDRMLFSAGYLNSKGGALKGYGTDLSHSIDSFTLGVGGRYYVNPDLYITLAASSTVYDELTNDGVHYQGVEQTFTETYDKETLSFALGVGFSL